MCMGCHKVKSFIIFEHAHGDPWPLGFEEKSQICMQKNNRDMRPDTLAGFLLLLVSLILEHYSSDCLFGYFDNLIKKKGAPLVYRAQFMT